MFELVLRAPQALVEPLSDALVDEWGALSVSVEDADAGTDDEKALFGEPGMPPPPAGWAQSTLRALFEEESAAGTAATRVLAQDWTSGVQLQSLDAVPDQAWVRNRSARRWRSRRPSGSCRAGTRRRRRLDG